MKTKKLIKSFSLYFDEKVLNDPTLSMADIVIVSLIAYRDSTPRGCWEGNENLGDVFHCSKTTVSKTIGNLTNKGYIIYNEPDELNGGRTNCRKVREDIKQPKSGASRLNSTLSKPSRLPAEKTSLKYKENYKVKIKDKVIIDKEEQEIVKRKITKELDYLSLYNISKRMYLKRINIPWLEKETYNFIELLDLLISTYQIRVLHCETDIIQLLSEIFEVILSTPYKYQKDYSIRSYINLWNKLITYYKINDIINRKLGRYEFSGKSPSRF